MSKEFPKLPDFATKLDEMKILAIEAAIISQIPDYISIDINFDSDTLNDLERIDSSFVIDSNPVKLSEIDQKKITDLFNTDDYRATDISILEELVNKLYKVQTIFEEWDNEVVNINEDWRKENITINEFLVQSELTIFEGTSEFIKLDYNDILENIENHFKSRTADNFNLLCANIETFDLALKKFYDKLQPIISICEKILEIDENNYYAGSLQGIINFRADIYIDLKPENILKDYMNQITPSQAIYLYDYIFKLNCDLNRILRLN